MNNNELLRAQAFINELSALHPVSDSDLAEVFNAITHYLQTSEYKGRETALQIAGINQDTEKYESQIALKESNERFDLATKATKDIIWDWDLKPNGMYIRKGYNMLADFGREDGKTDLTDWGLDIHPDDRDRVIKGLKEAIANPANDYWEDEYKYVTKKGNVLFISDRGYIVYDENHIPVRMVGAMHDITKRRLMELEKEKMTNDLLQRNKDLEQFTYIVSHNLRSPVANIIGLSEELKNDNHTAATRTFLTEGISTSILKLDEVIKDLNQVLQVKKGMSEKKEKIDFSTIVNDIEISIKHLIDLYNANIKVNFSEVKNIYTVKSYLYSIFYNLITNAIKHHRQGVPPVITIKSSKINNKIELLFSDNGQGIDLNKNGKQLFGLYKRFNTDVEGKGIGLFITKLQVANLGGEISVTSKVNEGSHFKIVLGIQ